MAALILDQTAAKLQGNGRIRRDGACLHKD